MSFTDYHLFADDLEVDQQWESHGRTITETDIVNYAGLSGDFNPIHMDHEFAKTTPFRKPIAHGILVWAISSGLGMLAPPLRTMAFLGVRDWQFKGPIFAGDTIRVRSKVIEKEMRSRGRRAVISWHRQILNQDNKVVQEGVTMTLVEGRSAARHEEVQPPAETGQTTEVMA